MTENSDTMTNTEVTDLVERISGDVSAICYHYSKCTKAMKHYSEDLIQAVKKLRIRTGLDAEKEGD